MNARSLRTTAAFIGVAFYATIFYGSLSLMILEWAGDKLFSEPESFEPQKQRVALRVKTPHFRKLVDQGALRSLTEAEVRAIETPQVRRLIRQALANQHPDPFGTGLRAANASAVLDLERGQLDSAWDKAITLQQIADESLATTPMFETLIAALISEVSRAVMSEVARRSHSREARRRLQDIDEIRRYRLPTNELALWVARGEHASFPRPNGHELLNSLIGSPPDQAYRHCRAAEGETYCRVLERAVNEHIQLANDLDRISESLSVAINGASRSSTKGGKER